MSDQLLDPDVPTLASQDKLKVSPKGLPFVIWEKSPNTRNQLYRIEGHESVKGCGILWILRILLYKNAGPEVLPNRCFSIGVRTWVSIESR